MKRILLALLLLVALPAHADPVMSATSAGVTITLFDEPCTIKYVTNLPLRATWTQEGKVFQGCFALFLGGHAVGAWFDDGSVAVIPAQVFRPVQGV